MLLFWLFHVMSPQNDAMSLLQGQAPWNNQGLSALLKGTMVLTYGSPLGGIDAEIFQFLALSH